MRTVKFRAFIKKAGWVIPSIGVHAIDFNSMKVKVDLSGMDEMVKYSFDEIELMQCTGLKDKNGTEIYEGDIVVNEINIYQPCGKLKTKTLGEVQVLNGMTYIAGKTEQSVEDGEIATGKYKALLLNSELFEVIGNKYTKPELLEGEK